jgi:hypothetical protein
MRTLFRLLAVVHPVALAACGGTEASTPATDSTALDGSAPWDGSVTPETPMGDNTSSETSSDAIADGDNPAPSILVSGQPYPCAIAVNANRIYWSNVLGGSIRSAALDGTDVRNLNLRTASDTPHTIALDPTNGYVIVTDSLYAIESSILRFDLATFSQQVTTLTTGQQGSRDLVAAYGGLFWINFNGGELMRQVGDGAPLVLLKLVGPYHLAVDDRIYVTVSRGVIAASIDGNASEVLADYLTQTNPTVIGTNADSIVWIDDLQSKATLYTLRKSGGALERVMTTDAYPSALSVDDEFAYWTNRPWHEGGEQRDGSVVRVSLKTGELTVLASGLGGPCAMARDETRLYWTNQLDGTIMTAAR